MSESAAVADYGKIWLHANLLNLQVQTFTVYLSSTMGILGFGRYVGNVYIAKDKAHIFI
jgi:hypothetical protein